MRSSLDTTNTENFPKMVQETNDVACIIHIEDYAELKTALMVKIILSKNCTGAEALRRIANKGGIYLIKSNYFYGENNFDLVFVDILSGEERVLDKSKTLVEQGLGPTDNTIILRRKKREDFRLNIIIEDYEKLSSVRKTKDTFWNDQLVGEALHKITRKGNVMIINDEDYGLFYGGELMDEDRSLGSFGLKQDDTVTLKSKKNDDVQLTVFIEDHEQLQCVRKTSAIVKKDALVSEVLHKIASRSAVGIPDELQEKYDLVIVNTAETLDRTKRLGDYKIKDSDMVTLRRSEKNLFGKGIQKLEMESLELKEKIGQGTFGKVYKATCYGVEVAVKKLKELPEKEQLAEFKNEVDMLSKFHAPQIVKLYGFVESPKVMCVVMELCSRGSLYHVMNSVVYDFGWDRTFKVGIEFVKGMEFLHGQNPPIVHRDFKSLNVLVTDDWQIKLCDFGLSRRTTSEMLLTLRRLRSTPAWSPPELLKEVEFTPSSDVYGMGVTFWEMCYRCINGKYQRPFAEDKAIVFDYQIVVQAAAGKRPTIPETTPASFVELIHKCWDAEPSTRPLCPEIRKALENMRDDYYANSTKWDSTKRDSVTKVTTV